jgi:hypothetical protein
MENICNANATELNNFNTQIQDTQNQLFVDTADFTLSRWEQEFGIEVNNNLNAAYRISRIKSKMRGQGTCTESLIQNVANSFDNGTVQVIEHSSDYTIEIRFISDYGIPPNLSDLQNALSAVMPAHLATIYTYLYTLWQSTEKVTWGAIKASGTWSNLKNGQDVSNS